MSRTYKRAVGSRQYGNYSTENLAKCLDSIKERRVTQKEAAKVYNIPRRKINYKLREKHIKSVGSPTVFTDQEENCFVKCIISMSDSGFSLGESNLRLIVKDNLTKIGKKVKKFKNNIPGPDWSKMFLKKHPELSLRFVANIKKSRAGISEDVIKDYINNLSVVVQNIPPQNIWNYDKTNLTDDPGTKKCMVKRGTKYPNKICNSYKTSISLMISGSAAGEILPPYVEWFISLMLPRLKKLDGKTVLIGDNLSSHISVKVLEECQENNIAFVCLPPNNTYLTQPLEVCIETNFIDLQRDRQRANLKAGFKKCRIYPVSADEILKSFTNSDCDQSPIVESFKTKHFIRRSQQTTAVNIQCSYQRHKKNHQKILVVSTDSDSADSVQYKESSSEFSEYDEEESTTPKSSKWKPIKKKVGECVVFTHEGELFTGKIINIEKQVATISAIQKNGKLWKWPNSPDILDYPWQDVISHAENPI
ncbi:hypothetical protein AGLY_014099 [Aphis glycines]|uniref:DDE-1 domain-containing protein n=1 Tax=Aphis glycines TaxID=307491 RepID=A0A6G0T671_APHGL|nr:hypothetical protein AGLY_014099 [Aphis glycines]